MIDERSFSKEYPPLHICGVELSNQLLLRVAAFSFLIFVLAEIIGALASNSLSLLGDAGAMSVDVFTYICNMYSEHVKQKHGSLDVNTKFLLEVGVPSFSVCALLGVTVWITLDAVDVLRHPEESDNVNVYFLFGFAGANFLVDVVCALLFYARREDVLKQRRHSLSEALVKSPLEEHGAAYRFNLNMASALTHVGGDTMRTAAVFIAAVVSSCTSVKGSVCDAWAAVVVTITIIFLIIPLVKEIFTTAKSHPFWSKQSKPSDEERDSEVAVSVARAISHSSKSQSSNSGHVL